MNERKIDDNFLQVKVEFIRLFGIEVATIISVLSENKNNIMTPEEIEDVLWIPRQRISVRIKPYINDLFLRQKFIKNNKMLIGYKLTDDAIEYIKEKIRKGVNNEF